MKKLSRDEMKKIAGGETPTDCLTDAYCDDWCRSQGTGYVGGICKMTNSPHVCRCIIN